MEDNYPKTTSEEKGKEGVELCTHTDTAIGNVQHNLKYLIVKMSKEGDTFNKISPFLIEKWISRFGKNIKVTKLRKEGTLLIYCDDCKTTSRILREKLFNEFNIHVSPHKRLNTSKGLFTCPDIEDMDEKQILEELKSQNISSIRRFKARKPRNRTYSLQHLTMMLRLKK